MPPRLTVGQNKSVSVYMDVAKVGAPIDYQSTQGQSKIQQDFTYI